MALLTIQDHSEVNSPETDLDGMEVDGSFCYNNVPPHFAHVEGSSVDQRVPEHWFELSCLLGREDPLALE